MKVNPETVVAILSGFAAGFLFAAGIFFLPKLQKKPLTTDLPAILKDGKSKPSVAEALLTIKEPENNFSTTRGEITVSGKTKPLAILVVSSHLTDTIVEADDSGNFQTSLDIPEGPSTISISAYLSDGRDDNVNRTIYALVEKENNE